MSSLKMTFSLASLILLMAFVAMPAMAHIVPDDAVHGVLGMPTATPPVVHVPGTAHALVESFVISASNLTATNTITATITFAAAVDTVMDDMGTAAVNEQTHAITNPPASPADNNLVLNARKAATDPDGMFTDTSGGNGLRVLSITQTTAPTAAVGTTPGTGAVWTVFIANADGNAAGAGDGVYRLSVSVNDAYSPDTAMPVITLDTVLPKVAKPAVSSSSGSTANLAGEWSSPFIVSVTVTETGSGLDTSTLEFTAVPDEVTFGTPGRVSDTFSVVVTPKPNTGTTKAAMDVVITATIKDTAGNEQMGIVTVKLAARVGSGTTETLTDPGDDLTGLTVPAQSYVILVHSTTDPEGQPESYPDNPAEGSTATVEEEWEGMPNLEDLLFRGGTITLTREKAADTALFDHDGDGADATTGKKADDTDGTKPRQYAARDVIITEVMAAVNTAKIGKAGHLSHQWIEIYNPLKVDIEEVTVSSKYGRPAATAASTDVLLDRLSNVVSGGWKFDNLGQNGFDDDIAATTTPVAAAVPGRANTDFVSFYRKERGKDGHVKGHWTTSSDTYFPEHLGTPGASERGSAPTIGADIVSLKPAILNEVANYPDADQDYEWIEILVTDGTQRFKNWEVEIITAAKTIKRVFTLPEIPDAQKMSSGGVLLVTSTDPAKDKDHPLAAGYNVEEKDADQKIGVPPDHPVRYIVRKFDNNLPDDGKFVLVLRTRNDKDNHEGIVDIAGWDDDLKVDESGFFTNLWPLRNYSAPVSDKNKLLSPTVQRRQHAGIVGTGTTHGDKKDDQVAMRDADWTGVGYKRNADATAQHGGTPGYPNDVVKSEGADATSVVLINEVMSDTTGRRPQWIELFNTSRTVGVNINNWSLFVVNHSLLPDGTDYENDEGFSERIDLDGTIPPRQTFLIVSTGGSDGTELPSERVQNLRRGRGMTLLNPNGFYLTLKAKTDKGAAEHQTVDTVGNLANPATLSSRRADAQSFEDLAWVLPSGITETGDRVSLARRTSPKLKALGTEAGAWISSELDARQDTLQGRAYYGHPTDISSPGTTLGGVLPVSLSKFRPERLKDTGEIVVRWITESELNNAGFNILRSETRNGEFTKLNTQLIAGQGTTSERTIYGFTDTSAKPNVVYYYQIQDVSLDGQVQTLRTTHLRGNVTAAGKITTIWAEIKALQ